MFILKYRILSKGTSKFIYRAIKVYRQKYLIQYSVAQQPPFHVTKNICHHYDIQSINDRSLNLRTFILPIPYV